MIFTKPGGGSGGGVEYLKYSEQKTKAPGKTSKKWGLKYFLSVVEWLITIILT